MYPPFVTIKEDYFSIGSEAARIVLELIPERKQGYKQLKTGHLSRSVPVGYQIPTGRWPSFTHIKGTPRSRQEEEDNDTDSIVGKMPRPGDPVE